MTNEPAVPAVLILTVHREGESAPSLQITFDAQPADAEVLRFQPYAAVVRATQIKLAHHADQEQREGQRTALEALLRHAAEVVAATANIPVDEFLPIPGVTPN